MVMRQILSPNYTHDKLANPSLSDLIDVFEDTWEGYVLIPCEALMKMPHGQVAAMTVLSSYFEAHWIYRSGQDSTGNSKRFFICGFLQVFQSATRSDDETAAAAVYEQVRC